MPRIDVDELREQAARLRAQSEELRGRTAHVAAVCLSLGDDGGWKDARYEAFLARFDEKTLRAGEFAERIEQYAEWLRALADHVEERWGGDMDIG